jgi:hypothetical protein
MQKQVIIKKSKVGLLSFIVFIIVSSFFLPSEVKAASYGVDEDMWMTNGSVNTLVIDGGYTYIGGGFTAVAPPSSYTGRGVVLDTATAERDVSFPKIGGTVNTVVSDESGGWYVGGVFSLVGDYQRENIAHIKSDGSVDSEWNPNANMGVLSIVVNGSDIYAGGNFTVIGGQSRNRIAKLNNTTGVADVTWNPNANTSVLTIAISGSDIYAGGWFTTIGGQSRNRIAKLNNTTGAADVTWKTWNPNSNSGVITIAISGSDIYAGGWFTTIGGQSRNRIAKLNNTTGAADVTWNPNASDSVSAIAISGSDIYAGGSFTVIGGQSRNYIAKLNNTTGVADVFWDAGADNGVFAIAVYGSSIYAGGEFTFLGEYSESLSYIARLDNTTGAVDLTWNPNANNSISAMEIIGNDIYVGGSFTTIGGQSRNRIAKLNNTTGAADVTWNPNASDIVYAIAMSGSDIYAGGSFTTIGGQSRNRIAKLNNTTGAADLTWDPNTSNYLVATIVISGSDIYTGGFFTTIGGQPRNNIAKLNNTTGAADILWNPNSDNPISRITISGNDIYVGGHFTTIGGQPRNNIAKLNNTTGAADPLWDANAPFKGVTTPVVAAITILDNDIYVGGSFYTIGGQPIKMLAKVNNTMGAVDTSWDSNVGGGYFVHDIVFSGDDMYVIGDFGSIMGEHRSGIARIYPDTQAPTVSVTTFNNDTINNKTPTFTGTAIEDLGVVTSVEFQIDGTDGAWIACTPDDGAFDEASEEFTCTVTEELSFGDHTIYIRTSDDNGNVTLTANLFDYTFRVEEDLTATGKNVIQFVIIGILLIVVFVHVQLKRYTFFRLVAFAEFYRRE